MTRRWLLALLAPVWLLSGPAQPAAAAPIEASVQTVDQARLTTFQGTEDVRLPHVLRTRDFSAGRQLVTYTLNVPLAVPPSSSLGIYIEKVALSGRVRLNGHDLGSCGTAALTHLRCLHQPLWFEATASLWRAGDNLIEVDVWGTDSQLNGLSPIVVGPAPLVYKRHFEPDQFFRFDLVVALQWVSLTLGAISLLLAAGLRDQPLYLWFGLAATLRALNSINPLLTTVTSDLFWTNWFLISIRLAALPMSILAIVAFFDRQLPRLTPWLVGYACVVPLLVAASGNDTRLALAMTLPLLGVIIVTIIRCLGWCKESRRPKDLMLLVTIFVLVTAGIHDIWRIHAEAGFMRPLLLPYTNAFVLLIMGGIIIGRVTQAMRTSARLSQILGEKVAVTEAELQDKHRKILQLERAQARTQEREQLMRDLHDGLGSSLASARLRLEDDSLTQEQIRLLIDECVDDMRLLVDTSVPEGELADAFGELRYRMDRRLARSGPRLEWHLALESLTGIAPTARLQVMRMVQEALSNALRHAQATRIQITAVHDTQAHGLRLQVRDNGIGIPSPQPGRAGRGLSNLRHRASQIGAHLAIDTGPEGTCVTIEWPLPVLTATTG